MNRGKLFLLLIAAGIVFPAVIASSPPGSEGVGIVIALAVLGVLAFWWGRSGKSPAEIQRDKADEEREV